MPDINNQYWIVGDTNPTTQVWSGPTGAMVSNTNATFETWLNANDFRADIAPGAAVIATANNGSGAIRVQVSDTSGLRNGGVYNFVGNNSGAAGAAAISVIDGTHFDITGSTFSVADSAGTIWSATPIDTMANLLAVIDNHNQTITPTPYLPVSSGVNYQMANTPPLFFDFTPTATGLTVKLPQMNLPGSLAKGRELLIYNSGGIPFSVADVNGLGITTPFGIVPGNSFASVRLKANTSTGGTFATGLELFPIEQTFGDSNISMGNFSLEGLITVFRLTATLTTTRTATLPAAASTVQGSFILITDGAGGVSATNTLSVARSGADTINGSASSVVFNRAHDYLLLETDGVSNFTIVGGKGALASTDLSDLPIPVVSGGTGATKYNACRIYLNSNQSGLTNGTFNKITFDTVDFDPDGIADVSTNHRITPNVAGTFQVNTAAIWDGDSTAFVGPQIIAIAKNGNRVSRATTSANTGGVSETGATVSDLVRMNGTTDFIEVQALASVISGTWTVQGNSTATFLSLVRVGP